MRALLAVALALAVTAPALAQEEAPPADAPLLTDAVGDAVAGGRVGGEAPPVDVPVGSADLARPADLVALAVDEDDEEIRFALTVASYRSTWYLAVYGVGFTWNGETYRAEVYHYGGFDGTPAAYRGEFGYLMHLDRDTWEYTADIPVESSDTGVVLHVPRAYVLDKEWRSPNRGDAIADLVVDSVQQYSTWFVTGMTGLEFRDRMPDEGVGPGYTFRFGDVSTGTLTVVAPQRLRVSNGGATTLVYPVTLRNAATTEDRFRLATADVPSGWEVRLPEAIAVPPNGEKTVNVLASIPFAHTHGGFDSFNVTVASERDAATTGRVRLGVLHTPIPQPAGHHDTLYLHVAASSGALDAAFDKVFPYAWGWMNTNETHEGEGPGMTPSWWSDDETNFYVNLNPGLEIGLDFDTTQLATFKGSFTAFKDGAATVTADLRLWRDGENDDEGILLAESGVAEVALQRDTAVPFELTLTPTPESDYVPYARDQYLALHVRVVKDETVPRFFFTGNDLRLDTETFALKLPLLEYHDRLDGLAEAESGLALVADGPVEKAGRPGTVQTYAFTLTNGGSAPVSVDVDVAGAGAEVGSVVPDAVVELDAGEARPVTLAVALPPSAGADQAFEVLVFAHAVDDPSKTAIARTRTTVTFGADANRDESDLLEAARAADRDAPGAAALAALAAVALAAAAWRRR